MRRVHGFTIIELLVVVTVLAILASVALPVVEVTATRRKEVELQRALWEIRDALDRYRRAVDEGHISPRPTASGYPRILDDLLVASGAPGSGPFLRRVPRDPFADQALPPSQQWLLRSYASPSSNPRPGADVYDVVSSADGIGLNGVPYREW